MERRHFFISRAGRDAEFAAFVCRELSAAGYSYYEQKQWLEGDDFLRAMSEAIEVTEYTLALFTAAYWQSRYTTDECWAAYKQEKLVGALVAPGKIETLLQSKIFIDLTKAPSADEKADALLQALAKRHYELPLHEGGWRPPLQGRPMRRRPSLELLPYLCDRESQEPAMLEGLATAEGKPIVFVVGAEDKHRPEKVRERLTNVTIRSHLAGRDPYVRPPKFIPWPETSNFKEFRKQLERAARDNGLTGVAPEDVIVVATDIVIEKTHDRVMPELLREYIRFWREASIGRGCLFVVCLSISYRSPGLMQWLHLGRARNVARDEVEKLRNEEKTIGCKVLPPLEPVRRQHVQNWAQLGDVQTVAIIDIDEIEAMFDGQGVLEIPMKELAPQLRDLLERKAIDR